jgi:hypothetical protein
MRRKRLGRALAPVAAGVVLAVAGGAPVGAASDIDAWRVFSVAGTTTDPSPAFGHWTPGVAYAAGEVPLDPSDIAVEADGSILVADGSAGLVRVAPDGAASIIARSPAGRWISSVDVAPDGSVLFADADDSGRAPRVWRRAPDGRITVVAGSGRAGFSGDGGRAVRARLGWVSAIAATRDRGFLIADYDNRRVRRVDTRGIIRTVAGSARDGLVGDGGAAVNAGLGEPHGLALMPDGGFLVAAEDDTKYTVWRVLADGKIKRFAGGGRDLSSEGIPATDADVTTSDVAVMADGSVLVADSGRVRRIDPSGRIRTIAGRGLQPWTGVGAGMHNGDGGPARAGRLEPNALAVTPRGDVLFTDEGMSPYGNQVRLLARPGTRRLVVAIRAVRVAASRPRLTLATTAPARALLTVYSGDRPVASAQRHVSAAGSSITLDQPLRPGAYTMRVVLRDAVGRVATDRARVIIGARLSLDDAADAVTRLDAFCRRFGPRRVDCRWTFGSDEDETAETRCTAVVLNPSTGQRRVRDYDCPLRKAQGLGVMYPDQDPQWFVRELRM